MKRLLAYLFIVLGLGLTFSVNADAKEKFMCIKIGSGGYYELVPSGLGTAYNCDYEVSKNNQKKLYNQLRSVWSKLSGGSVRKIYHSDLLKITKKPLKNFTTSKIISTKKSNDKIFYDLIFCTAKNNNGKPSFSDTSTYATIKSPLKLECPKYEKKVKFKDIYKYENAQICLEQKSNYVYMSFKSGVGCDYSDNLDELVFDGKNFFKKPSKKKIAKAEPSQTQIVDNDKNELENEKKKIAEEKKKIEQEKKRIAEAKKKQEEEQQRRKEANAKLYVIGSGTGFFVSSEGHVVSNDHVVGICRKVATKIEGEINFFNVLNTDEVNDLGLIKGEYKSKNFLNIKSGGAEFGEDIVAFGYPLSDALSTSVKLTRGIVSSLSGPGNNYSEIQIDAAIQPGNSGGPVLNMEGQVVGVASSGLNKLYMLESSEYIPENVNFAVAATTLSNFLKANGVNVNNASLNISNTKELAKIGRPATLQLFCMNTKAAHAELKKKKKHSDVLLDNVIDLK